MKDLATLESRIDNEVNDDNWDADIDSIDDVDYDIREMFLVEKPDGRIVWTTYVSATDKRIVE